MRLISHFDVAYCYRLYGLSALSNRYEVLRKFWITLNGGPAGRAAWRAVFPIRKHEFAVGWRAALKGELDIRAGRRAAH